MLPSLQSWPGAGSDFRLVVRLPAWDGHRSLLAWPPPSPLLPGVGALSLPEADFALGLRACWRPFYEEG